jgi:ribonuclease P protein component
MSKLFTLSKKERLKSKKCIETLFQTGKAFLIHPFRIIYSPHPLTLGESSTQVMVSVPKKLFRKAAQRNRIRRQVKEAYRLQQIPLQDCLRQLQCQLQIMIIYQRNEPLKYNDIFQRIGEGLEKIRKAQQKASGNTNVSF